MYKAYVYEYIYIYMYTCMYICLSLLLTSILRINVLPYHIALSIVPSWGCPSKTQKILMPWRREWKLP